MKLHTLKIEEKYYVDLYNGDKTFELRKNDRDFQVDDLIIFQVVGKHTPKGPDLLTGNVTYTENQIFKITYVLKNVEKFGLKKDYCILSLKKVSIE